MIGLIVGLSIIMWYIIDRFKEIWEEKTFGKYITIGVSAAMALVLSLGFELDLVFALGLFEHVTFYGMILSALVLMSGSSAVSEIITKLKSGEVKNEG